MDEDKNMNQNEIDSLLGAAGEPSGDEDVLRDSPAAGQGAPETIYGGTLSGEQVIKQADIDSLLEKAKAGPGPQKPAGVTAASPDKDNLDLLLDVGLNIKIELGRTMLTLEEVLGLGSGSVVELDKLAGDPLDIVVNGRLIARGEILVLNDNFCIRITDVLSPEERLKASNARKQEMR